MKMLSIEFRICFIRYSAMVVYTRSKSKAPLELQKDKLSENMFRSLNFNIRRHGAQRTARQIVEEPNPNISESSDSDPDYNPDDDNCPIVLPSIRPIVHPIVHPPAIEPPVQPIVIPGRRMNTAIQIFQLLFYMFGIILFAVALYRFRFDEAEEVVVRRRWW